MYISKLKLWNFRQFGNSETEFDLSKPNVSITFNSGLNALVGANDSGKTSIIDAIKLVLDTHSSEWIKLDLTDFYSGTDHLRIECTFKGLTTAEAKNFTEWLTYPVDGVAEEVSLTVFIDATKLDGKLRPYDIRAGLHESGQAFKAGAREYLKVTYLKPLRDAKAELVPRRNSRLSQILAGHEAFKDTGQPHHFESLFETLNTALLDFFKNPVNGDDSGVKLAAKLNSYLEKFFGEERKAGFSVSDKQLRDVLEVLKLSLESDNLGLGSHNLLFIAAELLNLERTNWSGLRLGLIEELEAHLHPQAQLRVVEHLQSLAETSDLQIILTTHSPNLASKIKLNNLQLCFDGEVFSLAEGQTALEKEDYLFLERFLDVTKANLFFANGIIIVEGWAEELILPELARACGVDLTAMGVSIVNVGSTALLRYTKILRRADADSSLGIPVSVVTDLDIKPANHAEDSAKKIETLQTRLGGDNLKVYISPHWTLEYCLVRSKTLGELFRKAVRSVYSTVIEGKEQEFIDTKLEARSLRKAEIAQRFAQLLKANSIKLGELALDEYAGYLAKALRNVSQTHEDQQ